MKKAVAFLLAFLIFVTPMTTLVKADVVIGDNDDIVVNENAQILGRKLAMLESLSELALSGVTEFTISNTNDVDTYLDSLWSELNDAIDYLDSGLWVDDIPRDVASRYFTNLVNYRDIVNNRGQMLGFDFQNPATSLLSTYFADRTFGRKYTSTNLYNSLDTFRSLSAVRNPVTPSPDPDFSFLDNINNLFYPNDYYNVAKDLFITNQIKASSDGHVIANYNPREFTYIGELVYSGYNFHTGLNVGNASSIGVSIASPIITINVNTSNPTNVLVSYTSYAYTDFNTGMKVLSFFGWNNNTDNQVYTYMDSYPNYKTYTQSSFSGISSALNYIFDHYSNINLFVDDVPWYLADGGISSPTLDIDGVLKLYGNDNPVQYELQPNTQIDYDQLYQVIYNAIRDNLPISQGDINYYDSHDTIYSPTIINNYGDEEGDEQDLIDTILDYAVIPKFDTAIAQPMRAALTNGVVIMNTSVTNVIPNEILLILGACFFLLLFAVVINRMIK